MHRRIPRWCLDLQQAARSLRSNGIFWFAKAFYLTCRPADFIIVHMVHSGPGSRTMTPPVATRAVDRGHCFDRPWPRSCSRPAIASPSGDHRHLQDRLRAWAVCCIFLAASPALIVQPVAQTAGRFCLGIFAARSTWSDHPNTRKLALFRFVSG